MNNEQVKERLTNTRELFKATFAFALLVLAGTVSILRISFTSNSFVNELYAFVGMAMSLFLMAYTRKLWMDIEEITKEIK